MEIEFSEDEGKTKHRGIIIDETVNCYYVRSNTWGINWIPKSSCVK